MFFHWIDERFGLLGMFLAMFVFGMALYFLFSGASYLIFFAWKREKYVPDYQPNPTEIRKSFKWANLSIAGNAILMLPIELAIIRGNSMIYYSITQYSLGYLLLSIIMVLSITETLIYWIHRALHTKYLYKKLHIFHHQFHIPTPLASVAFHPLDSFAQAFPYHLCAFLFPINIWVYHGFVTFVTIWAVLIHDRITWVPFWFVNNTGCHTAHHWYNRYNFGQFFSFWDRLCGTYRDPATLPERFFSSWPQRPPSSMQQAAGH